jgi:hypothetical protein
VSGFLTEEELKRYDRRLIIPDSGKRDPHCEHYAYVIKDVK